MLQVKSHTSSVALLFLALILSAGCAETGDPRLAKMLAQADAALAARDFPRAEQAYRTARDAAIGISEDVRYAARVGLTRVDAAATPARAEAFAKDTRDPGIVIGEILEARRALRKNGSDESLEPLLVQAQNVQIRAQISLVKAQLARGQTYTALKALDDLSVLPGISNENQQEIAGIRSTVAEKHRRAAAQATAASLPYTARFHQGLAAVAGHAGPVEGESLTQKIRPRIEVAAVRVGAAECQSTRNNIEIGLRATEGDTPVTVELDVSSCTRDVKDKTSVERVTYTTTEPVTVTAFYDDNECSPVAASSGYHTYCSGVYHKPGTSGYSNPNCDVRLVTVPAHNECKTVRRQREEISLREVTRTEPRTRTERKVTWTATGSVNIRTGGVMSTHPLRAEFFEVGESYPAVGPKPKSDFSWRLGDQNMKTWLAARIVSDVNTLVARRLEPDFGEVAARISEAQARGKVDEADEIAIRAAAFRKGSGDYLDQRFGIPTWYVPTLFMSNPPSLADKAPILPQYDPPKKGSFTVSF
jgi:hypothetical protein